MIGDKLSDERCSRKSNIDFFFILIKAYLFQQKKNLIRVYLVRKFFW